MQWDAAPNAGFCGVDVKPWMRVNDDYPYVNVSAQVNKSESVMSCWQRCLDFRNKHKEVFIYGGFDVIDREDKNVVAYRRFSDNECWITVANFSGKNLEWTGLGDVEMEEWVIGNYPLHVHKNGLNRIMNLRPWEAAIGKCKTAF